MSSDPHDEIRARLVDVNDVDESLAVRTALLVMDSCCLDDSRDRDMVHAAIMLALTFVKRGG